MKESLQDCSFFSDDDLDEACYIYHEAIMIPMELGRIFDGSGLEGQHSMITSIVIFNLALAYHLAAI
jgi:hypothetical protein